MIKASTVDIVSRELSSVQNELLEEYEDKQKSTRIEDMYDVQELGKYLQKPEASYVIKKYARFTYVIGSRDADRDEKLVNEDEALNLSDLNNYKLVLYGSR